MVAQQVGGSPFIGAALGTVTALLGWWVTFISPSLIDDAANTLDQPQYPVGPRLMLVAVVMATCAIAIWSRPAALTMVMLAVAFIAYSLLVFTDVAPALVPLEGWSGADAIRETLHAIVTGGASIPLLLLGGLWLGIGLWWLTRNTPTALSAARLALLVGLGIGVAVAAWWALPVVARAMGIMFYQGPDAFSPLPSLLVLLLAAGSSSLVMRWPGLGFGATIAALGFVIYSLARDDPASGLTLAHGYMDWWSIRAVDVEQSIRSTAFRPGTLELAAAWTVMAVVHLLALRPALGRQSAARPSVAD